MTYLQICQRVMREAGISGSLTTVAGQSGENKRVVDWVNSAWQDLQLHHPNWFWMHSEFTFNTTASDYIYTATDAAIASRFFQWDKASLSIYNTASGVVDTNFLTYLDYAKFRNAYLTGTIVAGKPYAFTIAPDMSLMLAPMPDNVYTVKGEYYKTPQELTLDADTPEINDNYQMAIIYRALMLYARYEAAAEIYSDADINYRRIIKRIEYQQLPELALSGALY